MQDYIERAIDETPIGYEVHITLTDGMSGTFYLQNKFEDCDYIEVSPWSDGTSSIFIGRNDIIDFLRRT